MNIKLLILFFTHALCNNMAEEAILSAPDANFCSGNFEELKLHLNPQMDWESFQALPSAERARVSVESYAYYRQWVDAHAELDGLLDATAQDLLDVAR